MRHTVDGLRSARRPFASAAPQPFLCEAQDGSSGHNLLNTSSYRNLRLPPRGAVLLRLRFTRRFGVCTFSLSRFALA